MGTPDAGWLQTLDELPAADSARSEFFAAHPDLRNSRSVELLHEEVLRVLYADPIRAERMARVASWLSEDLDDAASRAAGFRAMGHVSYAKSCYEEAVRNYQAALEIFTSLGRDLETGRTLTSSLQSLIYLGRYDDAFAYAARAQEIFYRLGDHLRLARLASNVGNILFRQDRYTEALAKYKEAHATLCRLGEHRDVAAVLSNIAVCQISLSRFDQALESHRTARDYCERNGLGLLVATADYNIAHLYYLQGDFQRAIEMYQTSREHCRAIDDSYHLALCDLDESEIYLELNLNTEASRLAEQAEAGFGLLGMTYERAKATVTHAIAASRRGQPSLASRLFRNARRLFADEHNTLWPALIDLYRAMLLQRDNSDQQAARLCRSAYPVLAASGLPGPATLVELLQSQLLLKAGNLVGAREMAARARLRLEGSGTPALWFHANFVQGQIEEQDGDESAAFRAYESARCDIERIRSRLWGDQPKMSFLKDKLAVYESLVKLRLADKSQPTVAALDAFRYIQQAKSRTLADLIFRPPLASLAGEPPSAREEEIEEARRNLNSQYRHMEHFALSSEGTRTAQVGKLKQSLRDCENQLMRLEAAIPPNATAKPNASMDPLSVDAIQATIPRGAMLLEYYVVKGVVCVCLIDNSGLEIVPLGGVEDIRTRMRLLGFQMRNFGLVPDFRRVVRQWKGQAANTHLRELFDDLVAPVRDRLTKAEHLVFAPHDFLHHLPFHALQGPETYLIDEFTISYAPSATVFALCMARGPSYEAKSLVLGLPDEKARHIGLEILAAADALPEAQLFLGEEATWEALRRLGPSSRFIHIAAHGLFRRDNPLFSAIRLFDSRLTLLDLYHLPLSAELVVLSGCSTGLNVVIGGDELLGLMRGVLLAGAHGVLVSLWDVKDISTAQCMERFYKHLFCESHKAAALQCAMLELRQEYPHPYFWAPFLLAGRYTPVA